MALGLARWSVTATATMTATRSRSPRAPPRPARSPSGVATATASGRWVPPCIPPRAHQAQQREPGGACPSFCDVRMMKAFASQRTSTLFFSFHSRNLLTRSLTPSQLCTICTYLARPVTHTHTHSVALNSPPRPPRPHRRSEQPRRRPTLARCAGPPPRRPPRCR